MMNRLLWMYMLCSFRNTKCMFACFLSLIVCSILKCMRCIHRVSMQNILHIREHKACTFHCEECTQTNILHKYLYFRNILHISMVYIVHRCYFFAIRTQLYIDCKHCSSNKMYSFWYCRWTIHIIKLSQGKSMAGNKSYIFLGSKGHKFCNYHIICTFLCTVRNRFGIISKFQQKYTLNILFDKPLEQWLLGRLRDMLINVK